MSRNRLPQVSFETGILVHRSIFAWPRTDSHRLDYFLIGKAGETPFLLAYRGGITSWWCQDQLGESLRKKILGVLREEIRYGESMPDYIAEYDFREADELDRDEGSRQAGAVELAFFNDIWRGQYLGETDEDFVTLAVPFAEKDEAKALGAKWDGQERVWKVKRQEDMSAFSMWMPAEGSNIQCSLKIKM